METIDLSFSDFKIDDARFVDFNEQKFIDKILLLNER